MSIHFDLRPYQEEAIKSALSAYKNKESGGLLYLATGTGKTVIASEIARRINKKVLFLVHREELASQTLKKFLLCYPDASCGIVKAGLNQLGRKVTIASIQTVSNKKRLAQLKENGPYDLIIADECHHFGDNSWRKALDELEGFKLGLTATPNRGDKVSLSDTFNKVLYRYSIIDGIKEKWLADIKGITCKTDVDLDKVKVSQGDFQTASLTEAMSQPDVIDFSIDTWQKHASKRKTIVFAVSVEHAEMLNKAFRKRKIKSACLTGNTSKEERQDILKKFAKGKIQVLTSCMVLTEGFDDPETDCVMLARPTLSESLYIQMVGRGLRKFPDKKNCLVIDLVSNSSKHRLMQLGILLGYDKALEKGQKKKGLKQEDLSLGNIESIRNLIFQESGFDLESYNTERQFEWVQTDHGLLLSMGTKVGFLLVEPESIEEATYKINHLYYQNGRNNSEILSEGLNLEWCISIAEKEAERFIGNGNIDMFKRDQVWRSGTPSEKQLALLSQMGSSEEVSTKGEASKLISRIIFERYMSKPLSEGNNVQTKPNYKPSADVNEPKAIKGAEPVKALEAPKLEIFGKSQEQSNFNETVKYFEARNELLKPDPILESERKPSIIRNENDVPSGKKITIVDHVWEKIINQTRKINFPTGALLANGKLLNIDMKNKIINIIFDNPAFIALLRQSKFVHVEKALWIIFNNLFTLNLICLDEKFNQEEMERLNLALNEEPQEVILPR